MNISRITVFAAACLLAVVPARADIHAVVVGINDYAAVSKLDGAVNDAEDIAAVLRGRGANVVLLTDRQATRTAVVSALREAIDRARSGDVIVFTYAGHGTGFPEALPGDEIDGKDETFLFAGFAVEGAAAGERLRDNDLASLLLEVPPDVGVLVVADSCHSGTMTRAPGDANLLGKTRWHPAQPLATDPLPQPDPKTYQIEQSAMPNVVFAAAARDDQVTPEVEIDGASRGALSWSIARALEGTANAGDGVTTLEDLRAFVRTQVRQRSYARQEPDVVFADNFRSAGIAADALRALFNPGAEFVTSKSAGNEPAELELAPEPAVHQLAEGEAADAVPTEIKLVYDPSGPALLDRVSGDLLARPKDKAALDAAVLGWRAARGLARWVPWRPAEPRLAEGDGRHAIGERITLVLQTPEGAPDMRYATLVNLASGGEVQYVFPSDQHVAKGTDLLDPSPKVRRIGGIPVTEPVGADNVIAIFTESRPEELRKALRALNGKSDPEGLLDLLRKHAGNGTDARVGLLTIYTEDGQ